jgi:hypothetical protein
MREFKKATRKAASEEARTTAPTVSRADESVETQR